MSVSESDWWFTFAGFLVSTWGWAFWAAFGKLVLLFDWAKSEVSIVGGVMENRGCADILFYQSLRVEFSSARVIVIFIQEFCCRTVYLLLVPSSPIMVFHLKAIKQIKLIQTSSQRRHSKENNNDFTGEASHFFLTFLHVYFAYYVRVCVCGNIY